jgi:hypothetical protein
MLSGIVWRYRPFQPSTHHWTGSRSSAVLLAILLVDLPSVVAFLGGLAGSSTGGAAAAIFRGRPTGLRTAGGAMFRFDGASPSDDA